MCIYCETVCQHVKQTFFTIYIWHKRAPKKQWILLIFLFYVYVFGFGASFFFSISAIHYASILRSNVQSSLHFEVIAFLSFITISIRIYELISRMSSIQHQMQRIKTTNESLNGNQIFHRLILMRTGIGAPLNDFNTIILLHVFECCTLRMLYSKNFTIGGKRN